MFAVPGCLDRGTVCRHGRDMTELSSFVRIAEQVEFAC